jgi:ABC-type branched-subunit amino acid transport system substrate-binding protein
MIRAYVRPLLTALLCVALLSSCEDKGSPTTEPPTADNPDTIKVGVVLSLSGTLAMGDDAKRGAEVAVAQINSLGGVLGKRLELEAVDDQSDERIARTKFEELVAKGVVLSIGPSTNGAALAIKDLLLSDKVLAISPSATSPVLDVLDADAGAAGANPRSGEEGLTPVFLRTAATDIFLATAIAQYASETVSSGTQRRCDKIVLVSQGDDYGRPISAIVEDRYVKLGLAILRKLELDPNAATASQHDPAAAEAASTLDAKCQIVIAQPQIAGAYMLAFNRYRLMNPSKRDYDAFLTIGSDGLRQSKFIEAGRANPADKSSPTAGEGGFTLAADAAPEAEFSTQEFSAFANLYKAHNPGTESVGRYASTAYDAVVLLAGAIERAQTATDVKKIRQSLFKISKGRVIVGPNRMTDYFDLIRRGEDINYEGASGPCDFLPSGTVRSDFAVWQIVNASFQRRATISADVLSEQSAR